jgi:hypothetical protein
VISRKPVEHAFRFAPVLVVLPIAALFAVIAIQRSSPLLFASQGTLWVSESGTTGGGKLELGAENVYASPSQRQADALNQLLATKSFALTVAEAAGLLEPQPGDSADPSVTPDTRESDALRTVRSSISAYSSGTNLMVVVARDSEAANAQALAKAVTDLYLERVTTEATRKTELAVSFYSQRLETAKERLDSLDHELTAFVQKHPEVVKPPNPTYDVTFTRLESEFDAQNVLVTDLQREFELAQLDAATTAEGQAGRYYLVDSPALPLEPIRPTIRTRLLPLLGALALSAMVGAALVYVVMVTDHSLRSSEDVRDLKVPVIALLPDFDSRNQRPWILRRLGTRDRSYARRLAVGFTPPDELELGA